MAREVTLRLPDETADRLEAAARAAGLSVDEAGARFIEESLRQLEFPEIEFRDYGKERLACVKGFIRVWKVIFTGQEYDFDVEKTAYHFQVPASRIEAAFAYYRAYPEESDRIIADNDSWTYERLKEALPGIQQFSVPRDSGDADPIAS
jgi:hypothetical protein